MKELKIINPRGVSSDDASKYSLREAVRAVVLDAGGQMALLDVVRDNYFKLPGGGVEEGEDFMTALKRECIEEIGCDVEVLRPVGYTEEYWREDIERQVSYCYVANIVGEKGTPALTDEEVERGYRTIWVSPEEATSKLETCKPTQWEGDYIVERELVFLKELTKSLKATLL